MDIYKTFVSFFKASKTDLDFESILVESLFIELESVYMSE